MDINPSLQICGWNINGIGRAFCPETLKRVPSDSEKHLRVYTRHPMFVTATSGMLTRLPAKLSKNGMRVKTSADRRLKIKLRV